MEVVIHEQLISNALYALKDRQLKAVRRFMNVNLKCAISGNSVNIFYLHLFWWSCQFTIYMFYLHLDAVVICKLCVKKVILQQTRYVNRCTPYPAKVDGGISCRIFHSIKQYWMTAWSLFKRPAITSLDILIPPTTLL